MKPEYIAGNPAGLCMTQNNRNNTQPRAMSIQVFLSRVSNMYTTLPYVDKKKDPPDNTKPARRMTTILIIHLKSINKQSGVRKLDYRLTNARQ
jgi:hypothetical protein